VAALAILDLERGAPPSRTLAFGTALLGAVLLADILREPEKALAVFVVDKPQFPKSFEAAGGQRMVVVFVAFVALVALSWMEPSGRSGDGRDGDEGPGSAPSGFVDRLVKAYRGIAAELPQVWNGNLLFGMVVVEAALVGLGAMIFIGRRVGWVPVDRLPKDWADRGVKVWWILPLILALAPAGWMSLLEGFRALVSRSRLSRATFTVIAAVLAGGALSFWYYPALAAQVSPKESFEAYTRLAHAGEPLALSGVRGRAAAYYAGGDVESFTDASRAFAWLTERKDQRRWLLVKADDLPKLNQLYRTSFGKNLPILDGRSSQILLASNQLGDHPNESWISKLVLDDPPSPENRLEATFEDQLETIGWEVTDPAGVLQPSVVPSRGYHLRVYYRVLKPITGTWKAFVHIDGQQRRFNGDHNALDGKYPMNLWRPGDVIVDDLEFQLEPNFTPGDYTVYFGFFQGETRFKVTRGPNNENRVIAGAIHVR
jgi:hypothetical protein